MNRDEELRTRLLETFRLEADDHLREFAAGISELAALNGRTPSLEQIHSLFRVIHTLKGAGRSVGLRAAESICQQCETRLRGLLDDMSNYGPDTIRSLEATHDELVAELGTHASRSRRSAAGRDETRTPPAGRHAPPDDVRSDEANARLVPSPPPASTGQEAVVGKQQGPTQLVVPSADGSPIETSENAGRGEAQDAPRRANDWIRIEATRLDRLSLLSQEMLLVRLASGAQAQDARRLSRSLRRRSRSNDVGNISAPRDGDERDFRSDLGSHLRRLSRTIEENDRRLRAVADDLAEETRRSRLVPAHTELDVFPVMVRDLCRETGKQAIWRLDGGDIAVDRRMLGLVKDALIHLVRNAIDHGVEPPEERAAAGKPPTAEISVNLRVLETGRLSVEIHDDGRGLSLDKLREAAVRARVLTRAQASRLSDAEAAELAFRGGISTSPVITNISGNGVGLSVVRERIDRLDGSVTTRSVPGLGVTVSLVFPASLATFRGMLVTAGGLQMLLPLEAARSVSMRPRQDLEPELQRGEAPHGGELLPIGRLDTIIGIRSADRGSGVEREAVVLVDDGEQRGLLIVDSVDGVGEVLLREFRAPLRRVLHASAAGVLGSGRMVMVLRPRDLLADIHSNRAEQTGKPVRQGVSRILVVDDSITTRTMERNLLESAGYEVLTAADGEEAWQLLSTAPVDLVISDIDMPRLDGFALTERIRSGSECAEVPVVLVTALETREDKERGLHAGANAYVLKSTFDQSNLLDIVGRLL
ncbi:MAG: response regulator [Pseudomonadota bacterium]|nr:response regulator [Pseudomonadota bacterium]